MEHWRPLLGMGPYDVSNFGRVRNHFTGKILKPFVQAGYPQVSLQAPCGRITRRVHVLVLQAFRGPRPEGLLGRHLDGNSRNNRLTNLLWGTVAENAQDKVIHGSAKGERNPRAKLTTAQVQTIRSRYKPRDPVNGAKSIASEFHISVVTVHRVVSGIVYNHP